MLNWILKRFGYRVVRTRQLTFWLETLHDARERLHTLEAENEGLKGQLEEVRANSGVVPSWWVGTDEPWDMLEYVRRLKAEREAKTKVIDIEPDGPAEVTVHGVDIEQFRMPKRDPSGALP